MKKHPIDDIFRKKLSKVSMEPSEKAWERIKGENTNKKLYIRYQNWYAAASILVVGMIAYMLWQGQQYQVAQEPMMADNRATHHLSINPSASENKIPLVEKVIPEPGTIGDADPSVIQKVERTAIISQPVKHTSNEELAQENERLNLKIDPIATVEVSVHHELEPALVPAINLTEKEPQERDRVIVVKVETPEEPEVKSGKLLKLFKQLKNVKDGEPVDWNEVGFSPKGVLARVEGKSKLN